MEFRVLLSMAVLIISSFLMINVFGVDDTVSWTQAPHHAPSYQPVAAPAPAPHHHHHHHHHKLVSPAKAPVQPPTKLPVQPPSKAPVQPPSKAPVQPPSGSPAPVHPPIPARKLVAVQGVVYCKACKYKGVDTLLGATPLQGAEVLLTCNNTKYPLRVKGTSDKNGYFFIKPPKTLTTYGSHRCKVKLLTSPMATCNEPTNLHGGFNGSILVPNKNPPSSNPDAHPLPYDVFTVGPFAFQASSKTPCPHQTMED